LLSKNENKTNNSKEKHCSCIESQFCSKEKNSRNSSLETKASVVGNKTNGKSAILKK
jgi:hypothetical protein